ncbi:MAG: hypothetical protein B6244_11645 [Candidatus Cloacimonetes bacterium 4572_55]|nr:MAG: hypothetical protein B6244_11645 [Candidatus Cloacimonetes bacterium 4572_55]
MLTAHLKNRQFKFQTSESVRPTIREICGKEKGISEYYQIGESESGRPIDAVRIGTGSRTVSLIAGAHSDEPAGPETLRYLIHLWTAHKEEFASLLDRFCFIIIPHIDPDGEARNRKWTEHFPLLPPFLQHQFREPPGRDVEFGFPEMRPENKAASDFISAYTPISLHLSLHGMGVADGLWLLIDKHWIDKTKELQSDFIRFAAERGYPLHDYDRQGEKGFHYIAPGLSTTPESEAMKHCFLEQDDPETAGKFHKNSMEFVRSFGGDPLCLVTEIPLFLIRKKMESHEPGVPTAYLEFKEKLPRIRQALRENKSVEKMINPFRIQPIDLRTAIELQLRIIDFGIKAISDM